MQRKTPTEPPEKQLLALHAAIDSTSLWKAGRQLLHRCFENHFIVAGFAFHGGDPMIIKRGRPAPPRDADWWARNCAAHPMLDILIERPDLNIIRVTDIMSAEKIKAHPYYEEFMVPDGWLYSVGVFVREEGRIIGMLSVNRREDQGDFTNDEMALLERLYPHIETSFLRVSRIRSNQAATLSLAAMLAKLPLPCVVVSWRGEISHINDYGRQACLDWEYVGSRRISSQNLSLATLPDAIRERCLAIAGEIDEINTTNSSSVPAPSDTVIHPRDSSLRAIIETVLPRGEPMSSPAFLVRFEHIPRQGADACDPALLNKFCDLSTAEKAVAVHLFDGLTNREIADTLGKSLGTVRKQTESIYRKLDIHDRRRLIALAPALRLALSLRSPSDEPTPS